MRAMSRIWELLQLWMQVKGLQYTQYTVIAFIWIQTHQYTPYFLYLLYVVINITSSFPLCVPEAEVHGSVELAEQARKLDLFWSGLRPVLDSGPPDSKLRDVVQLSYTVPDLGPPIDTQEPEAEVSWICFVDLISLKLYCEFES